MRLRQAVYEDIHGPIQALRSIWSDGGVRALFKGWTPTVLSLGPFIAVNFATFDYLKSQFTTYDAKGQAERVSVLTTLALGASAGIFAQSICYPLDTVRRNMQMQGNQYDGILDCWKKIYTRDGFLGLYRGVIPNAVKIVPNNGIRFLVYSQLTHYFGIPDKKKGAGEGGGGGGG
jgi:solute carrier family 25 phosphate transporter 23/24/25/41